ncbi:hypothetical protein [Streptomyces sp. NRRL F-5053]|uniref:hypothetical protein n=1 Tax=Streptomyces sp. NRRL F-5053 TaxID=1463854 RepID=UPI00133123BC|nr:hypothetical protein [Streptomyces sp. NRRL F-5053]
MADEPFQAIEEGNTSSDLFPKRTAAGAGSPVLLKVGIGFADGVPETFRTSPSGPFEKESGFADLRAKSGRLPLRRAQVSF